MCGGTEMTPQELFEVDQQVDLIMNNITEEDSLAVIRDALTAYLSMQIGEQDE